MTPKPQRQDSLYDQMQTVIGLAHGAGCHDAADWLRGQFPFCLACRDTQIAHYADPDATVENDRCPECQ